MTDATVIAPRRIGPDHRDLYLLIAGIVCGLLLGPWVLGQVAPKQYTVLFVAGQRGAAVLRQRDDFEEQQRQRIEQLKASGVTEAAIQEAANDPDVLNKRMTLEYGIESERKAHTAWFQSRMTALLLAVLVFMVIESVLDPRSMGMASTVRTRLATVRYAMMGIWLALTLARFAVIRTAPAVFVLLLVVVGIGAALVPLGRGRSGQAEGA